MVDGFVKDDALARLQERVIFGLGVGLQHQLRGAAEYAALVILIAELEAAVGRQGVELRIGVLHQFIHMAFQLLTGKPCRAGPDYAQGDNHTYGNVGLFHC